VPAIPSGVGGEKLMSLPLREAREVFEREYLVAQINVSAAHFAHGGIHRDGALGAASEAEVARRGLSWRSRATSSPVKTHGGNLLPFQAPRRTLTGFARLSQLLVSMDLLASTAPSLKNCS